MFSDLLHSKLCLLYLVLLMLLRIGNLLEYVAALLVASFWVFQASVTERLVRETQICWVANSNLTRS